MQFAHLLTIESRAPTARLHNFCEVLQSIRYRAIVSVQRSPSWKKGKSGRHHVSAVYVCVTSIPIPFSFFFGFVLSMLSQAMVIVSLNSKCRCRRQIPFIRHAMDVDLLYSLIQSVISKSILSSLAAWGTLAYTEPSPNEIFTNYKLAFGRMNTLLSS